LICHKTHLHLYYIFHLIIIFDVIMLKWCMLIKNLLYLPYEYLYYFYWFILYACFPFLMNWFIHSTSDEMQSTFHVYQSMWAFKWETFALSHNFLFLFLMTTFYPLANCFLSLLIIIRTIWKYNKNVVDRFLQNYFKSYWPLHSQYFLTFSKILLCKRH